jgi:hypothetical protein
MEQELHEEKVRLVHLGRKDRFPKEVVDKIVRLEKATAKYGNNTFNIALDYGGHDEIVRAIKKMMADGVARSLGLKNVKAIQMRAEDVKEKFHFVVSRAVTEFPVFYKWVKDKFLKEKMNEIPNGILYLKGGDLQKEFGPMYNHAKVTELKDHFSEDFFESKKVVYFKV